MLLVGALLGYFGRPLVTPRPIESVAAAATAPQEEAAASAAKPSAGTFMDAVVAQTRHFKGNADAPVTIVEFGDFQ
jgi:protein-disulfide isomerase